ncbi:MAG: FecR family protein [Cellulophaga sp.]
MRNHNSLIQKFLKGTISISEKETLEIWLAKEEGNLKFFKNEIKNYNPDTSSKFKTSVAYQNFIKTVEQKKFKKRRNFYKYAAIFIGLISLGIILTNKLDNPNTTRSITATKENSTKNKDITITLSDGSQQIITATGNEVVRDKKGTIIANKNSNGLDFKKEQSSKNTNIAFNEIFIPNGQTFKIKLSDGTLVWLNAGSKLRFPQNFNASSSNRLVYLEGEAFFEVTKNKDKPFIVNVDNINVKVLGTKFNVSGYKTDLVIATTLVEGAVNVSDSKTPEESIRLTPSFQASYNKHNSSFKKAKVDTSLYTGWMQNKLVITNLKFPEILKKLERMHNVVFINKAHELNNEIYTGEFENEDIETILETISLSTNFNFNINNNTITITK